jgi:predicted MFS family arabinose efflux permease
VSEAVRRGMLADLAGKELRGRAVAAQQIVIALGVSIAALFGGVVVEECGRSVLALRNTLPEGEGVGSSVH